MKARCVPGTARSQYHGDIGIRVCSQWIESFPRFLEDVGPRPSAKHSIDRYPNKKGNYEPGNVRWATAAQQMANKSDNVPVTIDGTTEPLGVVCDRLGVARDTVKFRMKRLGLDATAALTQILSQGVGMRHDSLGRFERLEERQA